MNVLSLGALIKVKSETKRISEAIRKNRKRTSIRNPEFRKSKEEAARARSQALSVTSQATTFLKLKNWGANAKLGVRSRNALNASNVVTEIHDDKDVSVLQQGNISYYTEETIQARIKIRNDPRTKAAIGRFWRWMDKNKDGSISKDEYLSVNVVLFKVLMRKIDEPYNEKEAIQSVSDDWEEDSEGHNILTWTRFYNSMFELVDTWSDSADITEYLDWLDETFSEFNQEMEKIMKREAKKEAKGSKKPSKVPSIDAAAHEDDEPEEKKTKIPKEPKQSPKPPKTKAAPKAVPPSPKKSKTKPKSQRAAPKATKEKTLHRVDESPDRNVIVTAPQDSHDDGVPVDNESESDHEDTESAVHSPECMCPECEARRNLIVSEVENGEPLTKEFWERTTTVSTVVSDSAKSSRVIPSGSGAVNNNAQKKKYVYVSPLVRHRRKRAQGGVFGHSTVQPDDKEWKWLGQNGVRGHMFHCECDTCRLSRGETYMKELGWCEACTYQEYEMRHYHRHDFPSTRYGARCSIHAGSERFPRPPPPKTNTGGMPSSVSPTASPRTLSHLVSSVATPRVRSPPSTASDLSTRIIPPPKVKAPSHVLFPFWKVKERFPDEPPAVVHPETKEHIHFPEPSGQFLNDYYAINAVGSNENEGSPGNHVAILELKEFKMSDNSPKSFYHPRTQSMDSMAPMRPFKPTYSKSSGESHDDADSSPRGVSSVLSSFGISSGFPSFHGLLERGRSLSQVVPKTNARGSLTFGDLNENSAIPSPADRKYRKSEGAVVSEVPPLQIIIPETSYVSLTSSSAVDSMSENDPLPPSDTP